MVERRREQRCICSTETLLHCLILVFLVGMGCYNKVTQISAQQHPKYFPIPEQPSSNLCHCISTATWSSSNQLGLIASLEKAALQCWAEIQSAWKGLYHISSGVFIILLADSFHPLAQICSMLRFLLFPLFSFSLWVTSLSTSSATLHAQHKDDEDETTVVSEHHSNSFPSSLYWQA